MKSIFMLRTAAGVLSAHGRAGAARRCGAAVLLALLAGALPAQNGSPAPTPGQSGPAGAAAPTAQATPAPENLPAQANPAKGPRSGDRRKAAKLYMTATKLFLDRQFEEAMKDYDEAAALDPTNNNYRLAASVALSHAVAALIQSAAKDRLLGNEGAARDDLARALKLDPHNFEASQHLDELGEDAARQQPKALYDESGGDLGGPVELLAAPGLRSFHIHADELQVIKQVYQAYGLTVMLDTSVHALPVRFDIDDVGFEEAARVLNLVTNTFSVALDAHRVMVAADTRDNRQKFEPEALETIYLTGMSDDELTEVETVAKDVFKMQQVRISTTARTITLRAPAPTLNVFNATMRGLMDGRSQVLLDVRMIQVAHISTRNTGVQLPQTITAFNVAAEEESLLSSNASLVQEIISSGLASPNNPLAILGILIASGQVSSSLLSSGFAIFGGGLTQSAVGLSPLTFNLNLNTSDSRELDDVQLRLQDGEEGTLKEGERYPIQTSSYSSLSGGIPNIPGLTGAGTSSSLSSLLSSLTTSVPNIPMVEYQDLGLTLTTRPRALRNGDVGLNIDLKLTGLAGTSIDGNPVLDNRAYSGMTMLREGEAAVVATEVDKSESLSISGTPGLSEIPGMNNLTEKELQKNYATIVIVITPHVVRGPQAAGHSMMMRVEKSGTP